MGMSTIILSDAKDFLQSLDTDSVDLVLTDPPYDLPVHERNDLHSQMIRVSRGSVIVFCPPENQWQSKADQYLFWVKPISTKNTKRKYSRFVEMIQVFGQGKWVTGRHWSQYTNVFTDLVEGHSGHPYEKPSSLIRRLVLNHSEPDDVVVDPFCGSGVIPCVAADLGRVARGSDIDEQWARYAQERLDAVMQVLPK